MRPLNQLLVVDSPSVVLTTLWQVCRHTQHIHSAQQFSGRALTHQGQTFLQTRLTLQLHIFDTRGCEWWQVSRLCHLSGRIYKCPLRDHPRCQWWEAKDLQYLRAMFSQLQSLLEFHRFEIFLRILVAPHRDNLRWSKRSPRSCWMLAYWPIHAMQSQHLSRQSWANFRQVWVFPEPPKP